MDSFKKAKAPSRKNPQGLREVAFYSQASLAAVCQDKEHPELRGARHPTAAGRHTQSRARPWEARTSAASPRSPPYNQEGNCCRERGRHRERREFLLTQTRQNWIWRWRQKRPLIQPSYLCLQIYKCCWVLCVWVHACVFQSKPKLKRVGTADR